MNFFKQLGSAVDKLNEIGKMTHAANVFGNPKPDPLTELIRTCSYPDEYPLYQLGSSSWSRNQWSKWPKSTPPSWWTNCNTVLLPPYSWGRISEALHRDQGWDPRRTAWEGQIEHHVSCYFPQECPLPPHHQSQSELIRSYWKLSPSAVEER